jgi:hypothetical protein
MDCIANGCGGYRPCKTKQVQLDVTDAILHFIGDGSALSHLNASNVDFGTLSTSVFPASGVTAGTYGSSSNVSQVTVDQYGRVTAAANIAVVSSQWTGVPGSTIYYIDGVSIGTSADATSNLQVVGNVYVSNALSTTNVYASRYYGDGGLLSNIASQWTGTKGSPIYYVPNVSIGSSVDATSNLQVTGNVYVSNAVTVPNVHVTDTIDVLGSMTANAANATFFFDTFTIPYINTQVLNVSTSTTLTGNLVAETANIATLNVGYLTVNSAVVYGATTLNVYGVSNLSTVTASNLYVSNAVTTTNIFAATETLTGTSGKTTLNITGNIYASNAVTTTNVFVTTANVGTLNVWQVSNLSTLVVTNNLYASNAMTTTNVFANNGLNVGPGTLGSNVVLFSNASGGANTFVMDSRGRVSIGAASGPGGSRLSFGQTIENKIITLYDVGNLDNPTSATSFYGFGMNGNAVRYQVPNSITDRHAFFGGSIEYARITGTGVSILTGANPTSNLQVTGNAYISNAVTTTNVFANTTTLIGTTGATTLNVTGNLYVSNAVTTTNVFATTANVGTLNVWQVSNLSTLVVTNNLYAANALSTTNLFVSNGLDVGPGTLGSNVVIFSNISGGSNVFVMDSNSNVGIGTGAPIYKLDVSGQIRASRLALNQNPSYPSFDINLPFNGRIGSSGADRGNLYFPNTGFEAALYGQVIRFHTDPSGTISTERMQITSTGLVGINTTTPTSNLHVQGNVYVSNAVTTTNVFATNVTYSLDVLAQGPYLAPTTSNSSVITQWYSRLVNTTGNPFWTTSTAPQFGYISTSNISGYCSTVLLNDGRVLFNQLGTANNIGFFNPTTNQFSYISDSFTITSYDYTGAIQVPDGRVIFIPSNQNRVGILNPVNYSFSTVSTSTSINNMHWGAVYEPTGNVIMTPTTTSNVGIFNTSTSTYSRVSFASDGSFPIYVGSVLLPDGRVLFVPNSTSNIGVYTPSTATYSNVTVTVNGKYAGGVLLSNGNVFMVPNTQSSNACIYNPTLNTLSNVAGLNGVVIGGGGQASGAVAIPDGRVVIFPARDNSGGSIVIYNSKTGAYSAVPGTGGVTYANSPAMGGGTLIPDGRIIFSALYGAAMLDTRTPASMEFCLHPFFNKF